LLYRKRVRTATQRSYQTELNFVNITSLLITDADLPQSVRDRKTQTGQLNWFIETEAQ